MIRRAAFRAYEWARALDPRTLGRNWPYLIRDPMPGGVPIPPALLRVQVAGNADIPSFLDGGAKAFQSLSSVLAGLRLEPRSVLDFGCGCGRVLRHWPKGEVRLSGCDYNPALVQWCERNLPWASFSVNDLAPPAPYPDEAFDLVYALSVFTHLPEQLAGAWFAELRRILARGGVLVFSTHGEPSAEKLQPSERERFCGGHLVVREGAARGSNFCNAYHPPAYVRARLADWDIAGFTPEGALGNPRQDLWAVRRR